MNSSGATPEAIAYMNTVKHPIFRPHSSTNNMALRLLEHIRLVQIQFVRKHYVSATLEGLAAIQ